MIEHAVVIAGGGPTGLMLAGELALAKIDVAIVERRVSQDLIGSRAGGLHARTIEVLDQRGIADRFLAEGQVAQVAGFAQDDTGVDVALSDRQSLRADYLVGCDGGRGLVRKAAGIEFPGWDPSTSSLIAEVEVSEEPEWGAGHDVL
jgi:2-polyprenyl-6-methoxyphenol hydroxylase-like FAD-dependent oxidoreductase